VRNKFYVSNEEETALGVMVDDVFGRLGPVAAGRALEPVLRHMEVHRGVPPPDPWPGIVARRKVFYDNAVRLGITRRMDHVDLLKTWPEPGKVIVNHDTDPRFMKLINDRGDRVGGVGRRAHDYEMGYGADLVDRAVQTVVSEIQMIKSVLSLLQDDVKSKQNDSKYLNTNNAVTKLEIHVPRKNQMVQTTFKVNDRELADLHEALRNAALKEEDPYASASAIQKESTVLREKKDDLGTTAIDDVLDQLDS
jgi:hypothetical protein